MVHAVWNSSGGVGSRCRIEQVLDPRSAGFHKVCLTRTRTVAVVSVPTRESQERGQGTKFSRTETVALKNSPETCFRSGFAQQAEQRRDTDACWWLEVQRCKCLTAINPAAPEHSVSSLTLVSDADCDRLGFATCHPPCSLTLVSDADCDTS